MKPTATSSKEDYKGAGEWKRWSHPMAGGGVDSLGKRSKVHPQQQSPKGHPFPSLDQRPLPIFLAKYLLGAPRVLGGHMGFPPKRNPRKALRKPTWAHRAPSRHFLCHPR